MAERYRHVLPFGAETGADGATRFRLWAPDCNSLHLIGPDGAAMAMQRADGGWFELSTDRLGPGDAYAYRLPNGLDVPDPAARAQADGVHGASLVVDPLRFEWRHPDWAGRPWETAVICELHVGTATPEGTFDGLRRRLAHFADTGITAIELMPIAQFSGRRGWGYDGTLLFAPHDAYGAPDDLKRLVDDAHGAGLMVLLDVVYNHFGPDGNYIASYASPFYHRDRRTPWGPAIDFGVAEVREFYVHNTLYWLHEYRLDGLRFDAVNQIVDMAGQHILDEIAERARDRFRGRHVHLVLENDRNEAARLRRDDTGLPRRYTAQWNDDFHHAAHVALTGERDGYYVDYPDETAALARALTEGFVYQGEASSYRGGAARGEPSAALASTAFVDFIQNHDQIGNRAKGERLTSLCDAKAVRAALALVLLSPAVPLLFQGDEWGETRPFLFFCDFHGKLAAAVREGRRSEFSRFAGHCDPAARNAIPDPNDARTFEASRIDWSKRDDGVHADWLATVARLLDLRRREIVPRLAAMHGDAGEIVEARAGVVEVRWRLGGAIRLRCRANLTADAVPCRVQADETVLWPQPAPLRDAPLPPWTVLYTLAADG